MLDRLGSGDVAADYPRPWRTITDELRADIRGGRWQPGDRLPTQHELMARFERSRSTVRLALEQLADEGFVTMSQGTSARVAPRDAWPTTNKES